jgi:hypothetical protein
LIVEPYEPWEGRTVEPSAAGTVVADLRLVGEASTQAVRLTWDPWPAPQDT